MAGSIFTEEDFKKQLYDLNRDYEGKKTWANLFASADLSAQQQQSALDYDYSNAMSQAYLNSLANSSVIAGSNVIQGNKQALMDQNSLALQQAFDAYSKQHVEGSQQIAQNLSSSISSIDNALGEQAKNTAAYANANYDYLAKLYEQYANGENTLFDNINWKKYLYDEVDPETGEVIGNRLKTWTELTAPSYEEGELGKEWTSLYDEQGNLTIAGADFFDQMQNELAQTGQAMSFEEYLSDANPELLNWAKEYNPYDYNTDSRNVGSFKTLFGMTSTDQEYDFAERLGGFTSGQLKETFSKFVEFGEDYSKIVKKTGGGARNKRKAKLAEDMSNELKSITDQLGITNDIEEATGVSINELVANISDKTNNMSSGWGLTGDFFSNLGSSIGVGLTGGASIGAYVGGVAAGPGGALIGGWLVGAIGAIAGFVGGVVGGSIDTRRNINKNQEYEKDIERSYLDMVDALVSYANDKRRQTK